LACYIPRWNTRPKTVTHPSTNRARRALTSCMPNAANHYATPPTLLTCVVHARRSGRERAAAACATCTCCLIIPSSHAARVVLHRCAARHEDNAYESSRACVAQRCRVSVASLAIPSHLQLLTSRPSGSRGLYLPPRMRHRFYCCRCCIKAHSWQDYNVLAYVTCTRRAQAGKRRCFYRMAS